MPTEKKAEKIRDLEATFKKSTSGVIADYRGIRTQDLTALRRKLRDAGLELKVVKNTLAKIATDKAGKSALGSIFQGPIAVTFGYKDDTTAAKAMTDYARSIRDSPIKIKGGFLGGSLISAAEVITLATLPPKSILVARVLGGMQGPIAGFVSQLSAPIQGFMNVLEQRRKKLEEAEEAKPQPA